MLIANPNYWRSKRVLIAGGCGFFGSVVAKKLVSLGSNLLIVDNLERGKLSRINDILKDSTFQNSDLRNYDNCKHFIENIDVVFHLAARVGGIGYSSKFHAEISEANFTITKNLVDATLCSQVGTFVNISTACVYPQNASIPIKEDTPVGKNIEETCEGYTKSKIESEEYSEKKLIPTSTLLVNVRPFNLYGIGDYFDENRSHVIPALIKRCFSTANSVDVWGNGEQRRAFTYIDDGATLLIVLAQKATDQKPVNLGHSNDISIGDLALLIRDQISPQKTVKFRPDMPQGFLKRSANTDKLYSILGEPYDWTTLNKGLANTIAWYEQNNSS